jgi:transcriptional regulator with GAF, ATPase, and Fis domain
MLLLKKPFTIAVANAFRHEEVLRLKDMLHDEQLSLYERLAELSDEIIEKQSGQRNVATEPDDKDEQIEPADLKAVGHNLDQLNSMHIKRILALAGGKINGPGGAAEHLGIHPNTLRKRMDKLGIPYKKISKSKGGYR